MTSQTPSICVFQAPVLAYTHRICEEAANALCANANCFHLYNTNKHTVKTLSGQKLNDWQRLTSIEPSVMQQSSFCHAQNLDAPLENRGTVKNTFC